MATFLQRVTVILIFYIVFAYYVTAVLGIM
jgi:hypothetical protein